MCFSCGFSKIASVGPYSTCNRCVRPESYRRREMRSCRRRASPAEDYASRSRWCTSSSAPSSALRSDASPPDRAPSTARPSAAPRARSRSRARCIAAAAVRPRATGRWTMKLVLDLVPQRRLTQRLLDFVGRRRLYSRLSRRPNATLRKMLIANGLGCWKTIPM